MDKTDSPQWRPLPWDYAFVGQKVWLKGTHDGAFRAYGPHVVENVQKHLLKSGTPERRGEVFVHYTEDLLVPVDPREKE